MSPEEMTALTDSVRPSSPPARRHHCRSRTFTQAGAERTQASSVRRAARPTSREVVRRTTWSGQATGPHASDQVYEAKAALAEDDGTTAATSADRVRSSSCRSPRKCARPTARVRGCLWAHERGDPARPADRTGSWYTRHSRPALRSSGPLKRPLRRDRAGVQDVRLVAHKLEGTRSPEGDAGRLGHRSRGLPSSRLFGQAIALVRGLRVPPGEAVRQASGVLTRQVLAVNRNTATASGPGHRPMPRPCPASS